MNLLPGKVVAPGVVETGGGRIGFAADAFEAADGREVEVGIRPEDLRFGSGGEGELAFAKDFVEELGATRLIHGTSAMHRSPSPSPPPRRRGRHQRRRRPRRRAPVRSRQRQQLAQVGARPHSAAMTINKRPTPEAPMGSDPITPPILVFGGPYSNLRATQAMRARAEELGIPPSSTICTGDVVAYCAEPEETTARCATGAAT